MDDTELFAVVVLVAALGVLGAIAANALGSRIRVPAPAIVLVAAATVSNLVPPLGVVPLVIDQRVVTVALVLILFDGGMHIGWPRFRQAAGAVAWLGILGTAVTAGAVALVAHFWLGFDWLPAMLLGAALAPTDPAVVFAVLGKREVGGRSGTILEGESGFNDPVSIALLAALLAAGTAAGGTGAVGGGALIFVEQMAIGIAVGAAGGLLLGVVQRRIRLPNESLYPLGTIAFAALVYAAAAAVGGSGYLAVFLAGIIVGQNRAPYQREVRRFAGGLSSLAEIVAFIVLGLSINWVDVVRPEILLPGLVIAGLLIVVIRPVLVGVLLVPLRLAWGERAFIALAGLKGAVPILLGLTIWEAGVPGGRQLTTIIFIVVLVSVLLQGSLVPQFAQWFRVPMRTIDQQPYAAGFRFNEEPQGMQRFEVAADSPAAGATIDDLSLGEHGWISLVRRDGASVPLRGNTRLQQGDEILAFADPDIDLGGLFRSDGTALQ